MVCICPTGPSPDPKILNFYVFEVPILHVMLPKAAIIDP